MEFQHMAVMFAVVLFTVLLFINMQLLQNKKVSPENGLFLFVLSVVLPPLGFIILKIMRLRRR